MYGPTWPFLLMYGSHDMTHRFPQIDGGQRDAPGIGASHLPSSSSLSLLFFSPFLSTSFPWHLRPKMGYFPFINKVMFGLIQFCITFWVFPIGSFILLLFAIEFLNISTLAYNLLII